MTCEVRSKQYSSGNYVIKYTWVSTMYPMTRLNNNYSLSKCSILFKRIADIRVWLHYHLLLIDRHDHSKAFEVIYVCSSFERNLHFLPSHFDYWVDLPPKKWLPFCLQFVPISNYPPKKIKRWFNFFLFFIFSFAWRKCNLLKTQLFVVKNNLHQRNLPLQATSHDQQ